MSTYEDSAPAALLRVRSGIDWGAEDEANRLLTEVRRTGIKPDWLSPDQEAMRRGREVLNSLGTCDPALRQGMFKRTFNPRFGQRPGNSHKSEDG